MVRQGRQNQHYRRVQLQQLVWYAKGRGWPHGHSARTPCSSETGHSMGSQGRQNQHYRRVQLQQLVWYAKGRGWPSGHRARTLCSAQTVWQASGVTISLQTGRSMVHQVSHNSVTNRTFYGTSGESQSATNRTSYGTSGESQFSHKQAIHY